MPEATTAAAAELGPTLHLLQNKNEYSVSGLVEMRRNSAVMELEQTQACTGVTYQAEQMVILSQHCYWQVPLLLQRAENCPAGTCTVEARPDSDWTVSRFGAPSLAWPGLTAAAAAP
jgi:hypothetical protein